MPILVQPVVDTGSTVWLGSLWLNLASDLADAMTFPTMSAWELTEGDDSSAQVERGASGRRRLILQADDTQDQSGSATITAATREEVAWLRAHKRQTVCVRDDRGRKFYGVYTSVEVKEWPGQPDYSNVTIAIQQVSFSEAV